LPPTLIKDASKSPAGCPMANGRAKKKHSLLSIKVKSLMKLKKKFICEMIKCRFFDKYIQNM
jgi:hypothetical protein